MSNMTLSLLIQAQDQATQTLRNVEGSMKSFAERNRATFKSMAVGGGIAFGALTMGIRRATRAYQAQERAEARLQQIATEVTGATMEQIEGYKELAKEMQRIGVVGDEVIIAGQSQLASFTQNHEVVTMLTKDMADLAVATYGVEVSQEQAIQTSNMLGRALQGQLGALTRTGILVADEYADAFAKANTEQERAVILSQIISANYGGLNEAMRETSEGGMQALQNSFGDLREVMGQRFAPMLASLADRLIPIVNRVADWIAENDKLFTNIVLVTTAVAGFVAGLGTIGLVLPAVITGITAILAILSGPIGMIALIAGVTAGLYMWAKQSMTTTERIHATKNAMNDLNLAFQRGEVTLDEYNEKMGEYEAELEELEAKQRSFGAFLRDNFIDTVRQVGNTWDYVKIAISTVVQRAKEAYEGFKMLGNFLKASFLDNLQRIASLMERITGFSLPSLGDVRGAVSGVFGGARADGGPVRAGTSYLVGERGPELFTPSRSGQIIPNGAGSAINMNGWVVNVSNEADENRLVNKIKNALSRETRDFNQFGIIQ